MITQLLNPLLKPVALFVILLLTIVPFFASAQEEKVSTSVHALPPVIVANNSADELSALGCERAEVQPENPEKLILSPYKQQLVIPKPAAPPTILACPANIADSLSIEGRVDAATAQANRLFDALESIPIVPIQTAVTAIRTLGYANTVAGNPVGSAIASLGDLIQDGAVKSAIYILNLIASLAFLLGNWLLHKLAALLGVLFAANKFATHPFVEVGWPFVLGIANLGFILALLFIAATTVLRLNVGGGIQKLLPRLLFAAIFINFSLLIGAVLIDMSRIIMAILLNSVGVDGIQALGGELVKATNAFAFNVITEGMLSAFKPGITPEELQLASLQNMTLANLARTFMIWMLVVAFFALVAGLFVRYIMLILLLIFSPLAYLALAIPGASSLAKRWWSEFIKYVLYGPAALFVIILATKMPSSGKIADQLFGVSGSNIGALAPIFSMTITAALLFAAAMSGKYMGVAGATAAVGFAGKQSRRLGGALGNAAKRTATYVPRKAGQGAAAAAKATKNAAINTGKRQGSRLLDTAASATGVAAVSPYFWEERKNQQKKADAKRAKASFGAAQAKRRANPQKAAQEAAWVQDIRNAPTGSGIVSTSDAFNAERLRSSAVGASMPSARIDELITSFTAPNMSAALAADRQSRLRQMSAMAENKEMVNAMNDQQKENFRRVLEELELDQRLGSKASRILSEYNKSLRPDDDNK